MRRTTRQEDHDHRLVRLTRFLRRFGTQHVIQRQPTHGEAANFEEVSTRHTIAEAAAGLGIDVEHGWVNWLAQTYGVIDISLAAVALIEK
jgi:hypothetical protein